MADDALNKESSQEQEAPVRAGLSKEEQKKLGQRNLAIALGLGAFIIVVFLVTILRLGGSVAERSF